MRPVSRVFGFDRGTCVDRYYIEGFLARNGPDVRGRVLEVADNAYTRRFGGERVERSDILHVREGHPGATLTADLGSGRGVPSGCFDCVICTQTLPFIFDVRAAVGNLHRMLKPGGVLLATFPGISQISRYDMDRWGDFWRFTSMSAARLFREAFGEGNVAVAADGNVLSAVAFLHGLAASELSSEELDFRDPDYEVVISVRAVKR